MAEPRAGAGEPATGAPPSAPDAPLDAFERDTAVRRLEQREGPEIAAYAAEVSPRWRAGRGPHGGYLAAMLLRALSDAAGEGERAPRSLTIHYARAPAPGPVAIRAITERRGRSLSTLSARMEQEGRLVALALAAFSVAWRAPEMTEASIPQIAPPDRERETTPELAANVRAGLAPRFLEQMVVQPRIGGAPFAGGEGPMEAGAWLGLRDPARAVDAIALALFSDALFSPPFLRLSTPATSPTVDLTIHFRRRIEPSAATPAQALCFGHFRSRLLHEGFFEEDGMIFSAAGELLAQSRQLAILMPLQIE